MATSVSTIPDNVPRVQRFARNERGRDFVIGDVHGAYNLIIQGMKQVAFKPEVDRLFSVGDLVDRGPESARCLKFLAQPYTAAVKGNHEKNLLDLYANGDPHPDVLNFFVRNFNMAWWLDTPKEQQRAILDAFKVLPIIIEIETSRGLVGLVHGDVPKGMTWPEFVTAVEANDGDVIDVALTGRERIKRRDMSGVAGVGRVYVGHTIQSGGPARYGNVYAVDTGAIFSLLGGAPQNGLTFANIAFKTEALGQLVSNGASPVMVLDADGSAEHRLFSPPSA